MICVTIGEADRGRRDYHDFLGDQSGHFTTCLFEAIAHAHLNNLQKLAEVFPGHVLAYEECVQTGRIKIEVIKNMRLDHLKVEFEKVKAHMDEVQKPKEKEELQKRLLQIARQIGELCLQANPLDHNNVYY